MLADLKAKRIMHHKNIIKIITNNFEFLNNTNKHNLTLFLCDPASFDETYYGNAYPELQYHKLFQHWITHGIKEGRLCSKKHEELCAKYMDIFVKEFAESNKHINMLPILPKIIIVTRVSRLLEFSNCVHSISMQHYSNIHHMLSYDDDDDFDYINGLRPRNSTLIKVTPPTVVNNTKYHYNLYCNILLSKITMEGWILFLDDDDELIIPTILHKISQMLVKCSKDTILIFQNARKDKIIRVSDPREPKIGEICISSFLFHTKNKHLSKFTDTQHGDYDFFIRLFKNRQTKPIFINYPIVKVNHCGA
jgi:hypothetical protein